MAERYSERLRAFRPFGHATISVTPSSLRIPTFFAALLALAPTHAQPGVTRAPTEGGASEDRRAESPPAAVPAPSTAAVEEGALATEASGEEPTDADDGLGATARVEAPVPARNPLDATAAGTTLSLDRRPAAGETLRDVLVEAPGARVLSTGSIAQFTTVTLRGSELGQTAVLLDDVPLGGPEVGAVDLSLLPLAALQSVEVYRGGAPAWLGDGSVGGVVRLVPRATASTSLGVRSLAGSFGTFAGGTQATIAEGPFSLVLDAGAFTSHQDFPYVDDGGTRFDPSDDREVRQVNAGVTQRHLFVHARVERERTRVDLVHLGVGRAGGFPGAGLRRTRFAEQSLAQNLGSFAFTHRFTTSVPVRLQARLSALGYRNRFADPYGTVGLAPSDTDDRTRSIGGRVALALEPRPWLELTALTMLRQDRYDATDRAAIVDLPPATRWAPAATVEARIHGAVGTTRLELRGSLRAERLILAAETIGDYGVVDVHRDRSTLLTGRVGFVVAPTRFLGVSGSFSRGARAASVLELFGNRSSVVGNPDLRPETGLSGDLGLVARGSGEGFCALGELRAYVQTLDDIIVFVPNSQFQAHAENLPRARSFGLESSLRVGITEHLDVTGTWNLLVTRDAAGFELPFRPRHTVYGRFLGIMGPRGRRQVDLRAYVDATYLTATFLAPSELKETPSRLLLGAGIEVSAFDASLVSTLSVRDLADRRGTDFLGYPLSGRAVYGGLSYRKDLP